jgi:hypothetical protein
LVSRDLFAAAQVAQRDFRIQTSVLAIRAYGTLCGKCVNASTCSEPNTVQRSVATTRCARHSISARTSGLVNGMARNSRHAATYRL